MRPTAFSFFFVLSLIAFAQQAILTGGNMMVQPGTVMQFQGPMVWQVSSGAQVTNDGRIEFLDGATLDEAPGSPLIGSGTEHAWIANSSVVNALEPGGLGLELTSADPIGPLQIVRGHVPFALANGQESIARWFKFEDGAPTQLDQLIFHFDNTELNGLQAIDLVLHDSQDASAPWVPMFSTLGSDQVSLIAADLSPREYVTAFHFDSTTEVQEIAEAGIIVFPTITSHHVTIVTATDRKIHDLELFDANGKALPLHLIGSISDRSFALDLSHFDNGLFFLRVDRLHTFKLVKE